MLKLLLKILNLLFQVVSKLDTIIEKIDELPTRKSQSQAKHEILKAIRGEDELAGISQGLSDHRDMKDSIFRIEKTLLNVKTTVNRIDVRTRKREDKLIELLEKQNSENRCLQIWQDYLSGKLGDRVSNTKASYRDLFEFPRVASELENLGFYDENDVKDAVKNALRRLHK